MEMGPCQGGLLGSQVLVLVCPDVYHLVRITSHGHKIAESLTRPQHSKRRNHYLRSSDCQVIWLQFTQHNPAERTFWCCSAYCHHGRCLAGHQMEEEGPCPGPSLSSSYCRLCDAFAYYPRRCSQGPPACGLLYCEFSVSSVFSFTPRANCWSLLNRFLSTPALVSFTYKR
jgi:hypothetical protein